MYQYQAMSGPLVWIETETSDLKEAASDAAKDYISKVGAFQPIPPFLIELYKSGERVGIYQITYHINPTVSISEVDGGAE